MGNSIDRVADGLYICGAQALQDTGRLQNLGIKRILNTASLDLYRSALSLARPDSSGMMQLTELFEVKVLNCDDREDCDLSVHFEDLAEFVEEGRRMGGVVVHCAAGVSRASTSTMAYLIIKENMSLEAAFYKVFTARTVIHPNRGFWRQLRELEARRLAAGAVLSPPSEAQVEAAERSANEGDGDRGMAMSHGNPTMIIQALDAESGTNRPRNIGGGAEHFLTAMIQPKEGVSCDTLQLQLHRVSIPGVTWETLGPSPDTGESGPSISGRARCSAGTTGAALRVHLERVTGVETAIVESA